MALVVRRELRLSFRRPEQVLQPLVFFLIVTTLFPLGLSLQLSLLRDMAPGVFWVAALLSSLLSLDSLFKSDADDGTLDQLALSGQSLTAIVVAKTAAHWLVSGAALVLVSPLVGIALGIPVAIFPTMLGSLALGTLSLSWLGAIGAGLTVGLKRGNVLVSLDRAAARHASAHIRSGRDGPRRFGDQLGGSIVFTGLAMCLYMYPGAVRDGRGPAHHSGMSSKRSHVDLVL